MFHFSRPTHSKFSELTPEFLQFARAELHFTPETIVKYRDCMRQIMRVFEDKEVPSISKADVLLLKEGFLGRNLSVNRQVSLLATLKRFLQFCSSEKGLAVLDPSLITMPRRPRRDVTFLTPGEIEQFIGSIKLKTREGHNYVYGLRFRALVEALLGSAMRISELLSLNRDSLDFPAREAKVVGKGGKERAVFFTDRALYWISQYLSIRTDANPGLFVSDNGRGRLKRSDLWRTFKKHRQQTGIKKKLTPHILRHTAATQLLFNGCPVGHIKEILGHERLETTCRYYLGLDHRAAKEAHQRFMVYEGRSEEAPAPQP